MNDHLEKIVAGIEAGDEKIAEKLAVAAILHARNTTERLIDVLRAQLRARDAELGAIRSRINELFNEPYAPNPDLILQAVFYPKFTVPDEKEVDE